MNLPIDPLKPQFLVSLAQSHLVVEAETGSGKSTRLPLWAAESGRVLVVEPRRVACTALAEFLATQSGKPLGHSIGYAIRFESEFNEKTNIVFVTPGVALRWFSEDRLGSFDTVIIDEFHERRWDTDLLLALLKQYSAHRLVLTSATVDGERLAGYLGGQRLHGEGRCFDVEVRYLGKESNSLPDPKALEKRLTEAVNTALDETSGDLLVFLPGRKEITQSMQALTHSLGPDMEVIPLHASVSKAVQRQALNLSGKRRVILATNVAETSLTIPGVTAVIDSGLERRTHQRNGRTVLGLSRISKASAAQRMGRAGRLGPGLCLRLWGRYAPLEALTPPELQREELVEPMLAAACADAHLNQLDFVDRLPAKSLQQAKQRLQAMNAINDAGKATVHGRALYPLPIDTQFAHLISSMPTKACTEAMVDLVAALSVGQRLWRLPSSEEALKALKEWQPKACDGLTLVTLLRKAPPDELDIDSAALNEAQELSKQIRAALELPQLEACSHVPYQKWIESILTVMPELAFVRREKRRQALGNGVVEVQPSRDTRFADDAEAALVLDMFSLPGKGVRQTLNLATCMLPLTLEQLMDAELGEEEISSADGDAKEPGMVKMHRCYAGRVIGTHEIVPSGDIARQNLVQQIVDGQLMAPVGKQLQADIAAWQLWVAMEKAEAEDEKREVLSAEDWTNKRLIELGVESREDLELIEASDLSFEGIPEWERQKFNELYPTELTLAELKLTVEYDVKRKRVTVVYASGARKADPKRWELPSWKGWRLQYRKASRVVDIR